MFNNEKLDFTKSTLSLTSSFMVRRMPALKDKLLFLVQEKVATGARNVPLALAINDKANQHSHPFILNRLTRKKKDIAKNS